MSTTACKLYRAIKKKENVCHCCGGVGHPHWLCATKKILDKEAKLNNDVNNWGDFKYHWWWRDMGKEAQEAARKEALSFSGGGRKLGYRRRYYKKY